jgi:peptide/nickel transport system permease protein
VARYIARRLLFAVLLVVVSSSAALVLTRLAPGDFASGLLGTAGFHALTQERERLGLDRPLAVQYAEWLRGAVRLDLGTSLLYRRPVTELLGQRLANTAILAVAALLLATLAGLPAGIFTGSRGRGALPGAVRLLSLVFLSLPPLVTSLALVLVAARTGWFPLGGMQSASSDIDGAVSWLADLGHHLVLPALALALPLAATLERLQSQAMADAISQPFTLAALARGVPRGRVVWRHGLRASLTPVVSVYGYVIGGLLSGSLIVEVVTAWPGLGRLMYDAIRARDLYLVAGCAAAGSLFLAAGSLASDLALAWADPRVGRA